ncbi:hypothetical protein L6452_02545 [Arctium lappa]|uniref:Uncharacterized protein n=1 Tax=Arctium lappa TaxID=4217 RepID=A0ACB9FJW1_ARCLA|nr:hypothetical protein L6452_02545 [Arctium lappa]
MRNPVNKGSHEENEEEKDGMIPLPSVTSKRNDKTGAGVEENEVSMNGMGKSQASQSLSGNPQSMHGYQRHSSSSSMENSGVGHINLEVVPSLEWPNDAHEEQTATNLQTFKEPSRFFFLAIVLVNSSPPIHMDSFEPMDASFEQDDLLDEEDVTEVDSDDGAIARFLTRDFLPSHVDLVPTPDSEKMDSTPSLVPNDELRLVEFLWSL